MCVGGGYGEKKRKKIELRLQRAKRRRCALPKWKPGASCHRRSSSAGPLVPAPASACPPVAAWPRAPRLRPWRGAVGRPRAPPLCVTASLRRGVSRGVARLLGDHTLPPAPPRLAPLPAPAVESEGAPSCSVWTRVPGEVLRPRGSRPAQGGRCAPVPPTAAPLPGGPELADGRHGSRAREEGCGTVRSRTPASAAEVTAPRANGLGAPGQAAGAGWRGRGAGKAWAGG